MITLEHFTTFGIGAAIWLLICAALAHFAGWRALASEYRSVEPFRGRRFHFSFAQFAGWVGYNGAFTPGSDHKGLYLAVWPIFRFFHPPLLVPWSDLEASLEHHRWVTIILLKFAKIPSARVRITSRLAHRLASESGGSFHVPTRAAT